MLREAGHVQRMMDNRAVRKVSNENPVRRTNEEAGRRWVKEGLHLLDARRRENSAKQRRVKVIGVGGLVTRAVAAWIILFIKYKQNVSYNVHRT